MIKLSRILIASFHSVHSSRKAGQRVERVSIEHDY